MNFSVIAISGKAASGKTTLTNAIKRYMETNNTGMKYTYAPFAEKLKDIAKDVFSWDGDKNIYMKTEETYFSDGRNISLSEPIEDKGRMLLINIGSYFRAIRPTVWADYVSKKIIADIQNGSANNRVYLIDDLRFKNELTVLKKFGGKLTVVRINRASALDIDDQSEKDLDDYYNWDIEFDNNGPIEDVDVFAKSLIERAILCAKDSVHN